MHKSQLHSNVTNALFEVGPEVEVDFVRLDHRQAGPEGFPHPLEVEGAGGGK